MGFRISYQSYIECLGFSGKVLGTEEIVVKQKKKKQKNFAFTKHFVALE